MSSRNAIDVYDPSLVHKQMQMEVRQKMAARGERPGQFVIDPNAPFMQKLAEIAAREQEKAHQREEERRRRDPTYRPDALDFAIEPVRPFDKHIDYYRRLNVDQYASSLEVSKAYKKLAIRYHPDKQHGASPEQCEAAAERFKQVTEAHEILGDQATRRQYDRERDQLAASKEGGLANEPGPEKPGPNCVDVELSLEELLRGCTTHATFSAKQRNGMAAVESSYRLRVPPGEFEGATFWHKGCGDWSLGHGHADLVFVVKQRPHARFERVGDDLWLRLDVSVPAGCLFFAAVVPLLSVLPGKQGEEFALVQANTLAALFGFDRSGAGEAVAAGRGMVLRAEASKPADAARLPRGDLVVKFTIAPPRCAAHTVVLAGGLPMPPLALLRSCAGGGLPLEPLCSLLRNVLLPHLLLLRHRRRQAGGPPLHGVLLRVGGAAPAPPGASAAQLLRLLQHTLPQLPWRTVHMVDGVQAPPPAAARPAPPCSPRRAVRVPRRAPTAARAHRGARPRPQEPLLEDEVACVAGAALLVLEAHPAAPAATPSRRELGREQRWRVAWAPGVRVRAAPSLDSACVGVRRHGALLSGRASGDGWVCLTDGQGWVLIDGRALGLPPRLLVPSGAKATSVGGGKAGVPGAVRGRAEEAEAEAEEEEDSEDEAAMPAAASVEADERLLSDGCTAGWAAMALPSAAAIHRCHCAGGLVVALDAACAFLGQRPTHRRRRTARRGGRTEASPAARLWPHLLPYLVGPLAAPRAVPSAEGAARPVEAGAAWRRLCRAARRGGADDCSLGFNAVGMPPGCVLAALSAQRFALRTMLGAAAPARLSLPALQEEAARGAERRRRRLIDAKREDVLRRIRAEMELPSGADGSVEEMAEPSASGGLDVMGTRRGQCNQCTDCPGYAMPRLRNALNSTLVMCCLHCGCDAAVHEDLTQAKKKSVDDDDVTRRKMKPPEERR